MWPACPPGGSNPDRSFLHRSLGPMAGFLRFKALIFFFAEWNELVVAGRRSRDVVCNPGAVRGAQ